MRQCSRSEKSGMALPMVVLIVSALLVISLNIFQNVFTEQILVGSLRDSFVAVYSADQAAERALYLDLVANALTVPPNYTEQDTLANGACYTMGVRRVGAFMFVETTANYPCAAGEFAARRSLLVQYQK